MKKSTLQLYLILFTALFAFNSCLKDNDKNPNYGYTASAGLMYFVNSYPDATSGLLYRLDGEIIGNPLDGSPMILQYQVFSGARWLHPGKRKLTITSADDRQNILVDTTLTIKADSGYTSFVYGSEENVVFAMAQDKTIEDLKQNESGIRFLNLAEDIGQVNLFIEGNDEPLYTNRPVETGILLKQHEAFQAQNSGTYTLKVTDQEGRSLAIREAKELRRGFYYTIMLTGKANNEKTPLYLGIVEHR